jgi:hypothetical protein
VSPGQTFSLYIGAGGSGGAGYDYPYSYAYPSAGEQSYISGLITANGGAAGAIMDISRPGGIAYTYVDYFGVNGASTAYGIGGLGDTTLSGGGVGTKGSGGGGGIGVASGSSVTNGGAGGAGYALIEYYDPTGVVLKPPFDTLKQELRNQGLTIS